MAKSNRLKTEIPGLSVDTTFADGSKAGDGVLFMASDHIDERTALRMAISIMFGPAGRALRRPQISRKELDALIEESRADFEHYMRLAPTLCSFSEENPYLKEEPCDAKSSGLDDFDINGDF
jgi:hypothetical protein